MDYKKISVLIVTYKQADVIGRNIDSILQQKEYGLHEIVICDDCSPDNNWEVIQNYVEKYPNIIRAYRNNPNLGIYGNSDKCASLHGDADLFCWLEGDDALCDGFFKAIQGAIVEQKIDVSQPVGIQANYKVIDTNGNVRIIPNDYLSGHKCNPTSAKIRSLTTWRASVFSKSVIDQFQPTILNEGLALAESLFDGQWFKYVKKVYYTNVCGSMYYSGIGVSVELSHSKKEKWARETAYKWEYLSKYILKDKKDIIFAKSQVYLAEFTMNQTLRSYLCFAFYYIWGNIGYKYNMKYMLSMSRKIRRI